MVEAKAPEGTEPKTEKCNGCGEIFPSRNAVFKHLKETDGACLSADDYKNFVRYVRKAVKPPKVVLLYGYLPYKGCSNSSEDTSETLKKDAPIIRNGQDAGNILIETIQQLQNEIDGLDDDDDDDSDGDIKNPSSVNKVNRSYGHFSRSAECVQQDMDTGAVTEVMTMRLYALRAGMSMDDWLGRVQQKLDEKFELKDNAMTDSDSRRVTPIRILGRQDMPNKKFNAEMDVTYRRIEYLLPLDFLTWPLSSENQKKIVNLPIFASNHKHEMDHVADSTHPPDEWAKNFMREFKNKMKMLTTRVVKLESTDELGIMQKEINKKRLKFVKGKAIKKSKREHKREAEEAKSKAASETTPVESNKNLTVLTGAEDTQQNAKKEKSDETNDKDSGPTKVKATNVLKRKRYHNFTEKSMAHDYLTYRRMDRIYHRATLKFSDEGNEHVGKDDEGRTYLVLSLSGDLFLTGQVFRVVGVLLALANGLIDPEFVDCVFDENFPHLVPTPPAPLCGMVSCEVHYANQEGKTKRILSPRVSDRFTQGWNDHATLRRVKDWQNEVYKFIANKWKRDGYENGRLKIEEEWTKNTLLPWAEKAKQHLEDYKAWKKSQEDSAAAPTDGAGTTDNSSKENEAMVVSPEKLSVDPAVPEVYQEVLGHLRQLDSSGEWPTTSSKRQLVMISTETASDDSKKPETLTIACSKAKRNIQTVSSAYSFKEGQGGASGSFSVGYMPGGANKQPKANAMFPELVKAAFDLETKLFPNREPSSTIAINRNAQFRPHTDSGAGAGQSTSLIVGLGTYDGGELMVEGEKNDIRYKGIEFDGWKQRHWTMPFQGERFSLVWFTPKGCEGMKGIDLYSQ